MLESDYPHWYSPWPHARERIGVFSRLYRIKRRTKISELNARSLYNLPESHVHNRAENNTGVRRA
jgi:hypothetical protein